MEASMIIYQDPFRSKVPFPPGENLQQGKNIVMKAVIFAMMLCNEHSKLDVYINHLMTSIK